MAWSNAVVVNGGLNMLNQSAGITLDYAAGGTGVENAPALMAQTALKNQKQVLPIVDIREVEHGKKLNILVSNTGLAVGYKLQQIGIWAHTGDETPKLFAILQDDSGIAVPAEAEVADFSLNFYAVIKYSGEASFSLSVDPSALVSHADLAEEMKGKQDKLTGAEGQIAGFDADGELVAQDPPESGVSSFNGRKGAVAPKSGDYTAKDVGALSADGTAVAATKLETARTIRTNLGSTAAEAFDGTGDVTPGVMGTLGVGNGGTGVASLDALKTALGITDGVRIQTGSYVGTGTYGQNNPNTLTFDFVPKAVWIIPNATYEYYFAPPMVYPSGEMKSFYVSGTYSNGKNFIYEFNGNTVSWYTTATDSNNYGNPAGFQFNVGGTTYIYIAIG